MRGRLASIAVFLLAALAALHARQGPSVLLASSPFEGYLELLRQQADIPGMSAAIVQNGEILWERGFGFQNQENRIRARPDTPYLVGDLTSTLAAVLALQCVEQRRLELDVPIRSYGVAIPEQATTLRHLLSHTSSGGLGTTFHYSPERFGLISGAVEWCAPQPYRKSVAHRLLDRLGMQDSVPGRDLANANVVPEGLFEQAALDRYARVLERLAVPYKADKGGRVVRSEIMPLEGISASGGLVSTVRDLARFDAALDAGVLLAPETLGVAWTNVATGPERIPLPTGLGWFVQKHEGQNVVWHFGLIPNGYSSLIIKLPARRLTLILLANSDGLSGPFQLANGDLKRSLFATLFLRMFT